MSPIRMPFTAFHVVPVWAAYVRWPRRFDVLALSLGAMVADLEILIVYSLTGDPFLSRGLMHSILGVLTVNLIVALLTARHLVPWAATCLDRRFPGTGWRRFAHRDLVDDRKGPSVAAVSAVLGGSLISGSTCPTMSTRRSSGRGGMRRSRSAHGPAPMR
jgi:hypothetical protein